MVRSRFTFNNKLALIGMLALFVVLLAACGGNDSNNEAASASAPGASSPAASPAATPEASTEAETVVYKDALGREVKIPAHPRRIITTQYLPEMIAAGVKPVGVATHLLTNFASIKDQTAGIEDIGAANDPDMEKILTLKPDLIIATEWNEALLDKLNAIAPTIVVRWAENDAFQHFRDVAGVLGLADKAEQWTQDFDRRAEEAQAKLASFVKEGETFGVVVIGGYEKGQLRIYGDSNVGFVLYDSLKLPMTHTVKAAMEKDNYEQGMNVSLEKLPEYASADRLFLITFDNDPDFVKQVSESSLWKNLPAFKNNKVYAVNPDLWFSYDVMSFSAQLDDAVKLLAQ